MEQERIDNFGLQIRLGDCERRLNKLMDALTPSDATAAEYSDRFIFEIYHDYDIPVTVPWATVREIMAAILAFGTGAIPAPEIPTTPHHPEAIDK